MTIQNTENSSSQTTQGFMTSPRCIVLVDGYRVNTTSVDLSTAQFGYSDTFTVYIPLIDQPPPINRNYFTAHQRSIVKIYIGFPSNPQSYSTQDLELLFTGKVDTMEDNACENSITLEGRDLSSLFIDTKINDKYPNQTSSQIVSKFANQQGLTPQVTPTSTIVGNYYNNENTLLANQSSQWDLMTYLAQQENFQLFVENNTLYFKPANTSRNVIYTIPYTPASDSNSSPITPCTNLLIKTNSGLAGSVKVTVVVSYSPKTGTAFSATAATKIKGSTSSEIRKYRVKKSGLTPQQAQALAEQLLREHTNQGICLEIRRAGDNLLKKDSIIQTSGLDPFYDQIQFFPDQINRSISINEYSLYCYSRNASPAQEPDQNSQGTQ